MTSWNTSLISAPKNSGRYLRVFTTSGARCRDMTPDQREERFGPEGMAVVEHVESHRVPCRPDAGAGVTGTAADCVAASSAASAALSWRVA